VFWHVATTLLNMLFGFFDFALAAAAAAPELGGSVSKLACFQSDSNSFIIFPAICIQLD